VPLTVFKASKYLNLDNNLQFPCHVYPATEKASGFISALGSEFQVGDSLGRTYGEWWFGPSWAET